MPFPSFIPKFHRYSEEQSADGGEGGVKQPAKSEKMFTAEYTTELREEAKLWRLKAEKAAKEREEKEKEAATAKEDAERVKTEAKQAADQRIIKAEIKALAVKEGIVDVDGLKLVDLSQLKLGEDGELDTEAAIKVVEKLKKDKPYLFTTPTTTHTGAKPAPKGGTPKSALEMTADEFKAAKNSRAWRNT